MCRHLDGNSANNVAQNLAWGTYKQNHQDSVRHGTNSTGYNSPNSKLTADKVEAIFKLALAGARTARLAEAFGISKTNVGLILNGECWKDITLKLLSMYGPVPRGHAMKRLEEMRRGEK